MISSPTLDRALLPYVATTDGSVLYLETVGAGPPLLFITGSDGDLRSHCEVTPFLSSLIRAFTVIAYDQRGLGSSPPGRSTPTMADFADDAAGIIDAIDAQRLPVLGYSFGGMVAQELALRHPDRIERLVLLCTSSGGAGGSSFPVHELRTLPADERHDRSLELWDTRRTAAWRAEHPHEYAAAVAELVRIEAVAADPARTTGMAQQLEARRHHDTYERLSAITAPTLVVGGRYDGIVPKANLDLLTDQIPTARLAMFEGGHRVLWQDPAAAEALVAFTSSSSPP